VIDEYKTLRREVRNETKVQGSRFIATASPAASRDEADAFVSRVRKEFFDATHNCFAYRLGVEGNVFRYNDEGEPAGSAGRSILSAIDSASLTEVVVVVTRYFGGTKLGVGGLARAYSKAAQQALALSETVMRYKTETLRATFPHSHISNVMRVVSMLGAKIADTSYDEEVHAVLEIRSSKVNELRELLVDHTSGNIRFT
jgi:uncharacterized YigZ family protein